MQMNSTDNAHYTPVWRLAPGHLIETAEATHRWAVIRSIHQPTAGVRRLELEDPTTGRRLNSQTFPVATRLLADGR
jgi:hypothetical protein